MPITSKPSVPEPADSPPSPAPPPSYESGDYFVCTKDDYWTPEKSDRAIHPDAVSGEDVDFGGGEYCESYKCPNCGKKFYVELPQ